MSSTREYFWQLAGDYSIRSMPVDDFQPLFLKHSQEIFDDETTVFRLRDALNEDERGRLRQLNQNMGDPFTLRLGVFHRDEFVGWHFGRQDSGLSFYMQNSAILPAHRRQGLYAELVRRVVEAATEAGFQSIWSRHIVSNNAVIIPKLKQGFLITALEISDLFGTLVQLTCYPKEIRRKIHEFRAGQIKPDEEVRKYLGL